MAEIEQIILSLLSGDNTVLQKASADLHEAMKRPEAVQVLCEIVKSSDKPQVRLYAVVVLKKRFSKLRNWQSLQPAEKEFIKQNMLNMLISEPERSVRNGIAIFVGVLVRHEAQGSETWMTQLLQFIYGQCSSANPKESELGSSIFATLSDVAPDQFVPHMEFICNMFTSALVATEASGNMASPVILNILTGMTHLVPFILGHNAAEGTYQKAVPLIIKSLQAFAVQPDVTQFVRAFDILESMADYTPKLLTQNIKMLLDFCLEASNNAQLDSAVRVKTVAYIGLLVRLKKKVIIKQKLIEPIIQVVFNLMSTEPEDGDDDEEYFLGEDNSNPMTTATQTMDLLALNVPPEKLIPPLLNLLNPALQGEDPLPRRAAFLCMAVIAEGCSEAIRNKHLETMLSIIKVGITDTTPLVRNAAFFALGQFSEHLQPDISKFAPQILPIMFEFLHHLCNELSTGGTEPKHIDRMFYALETFCENLEEELIPHLPMLMEILFQALNPQNSSHLRELAFSSISAVANATKENMLPYFERLIAILQPYLNKTETNENMVCLRPQAIDALAAIARTIGKENFMPLTNTTMDFALGLLSEADDPEERRALYNLIASLSEVVKDEMAPVFPKIMERLFESILTTDEVIPEFREDVLDVPSVADDNDEIDIELSDSEDNDLNNIAGYSVENSYLDEKEEAILAVKEFAVHSPIAFSAFLQPSYENVYKMIEHPQEDIRKVSIDALCAILIALYKNRVYTGLETLVPKLCQIVRDDEEVSVVIGTLENMSDLLRELQPFIYGDTTMKPITDAVYTCINDVLSGKIACQFDEPTVCDDDDIDDSEYDEAVVEAAGNMLSVLGNTVTPQAFNIYFRHIYRTICEKLINAKKDGSDSESQRSFAYGVLAECFGPLEQHAGEYFVELLPVMLGGLSDEYDQARQNAAFGLGELVFHSKEKSYDSYPIILNALSECIVKESRPSTLDNICGAIARLIQTNSALVPLEQVFPVFLKYLPLREDFDENANVLKCFQVVYIQAPQVMAECAQSVLAVGIHMLMCKEYVDDDTRQMAESLVREFNEKFPDQMQALASASPEVAAFLQSI